MRAAHSRSVSAHPSFRLSSHALMRVNNMPFKSLRSRSHEALERAFARLREAEDWKASNVGGVLSKIHALAPQVSSEARRKVLLPLKRDVFNDRRGTVSLDRVRNLIGDPAVIRWCVVQEEIADLHARIDDLHAAALLEERRKLQELCRYPNFQKALVLSSRSCYKNVVRYADAPVEEHGSRLRKAEPAILQYVTRAMTRTSPFSSYTSVGMAVWDDGGGAIYPPIALSPERASMVQPDHALVRRLLESVVRHEEVRTSMSYELCRELGLGDGRIVFDAYSDDPATQPKVFKTTRRRSSVRSSPALRALVRWMEDGLEETAVPYGEIVSVVTSWIGGAQEQQARRFVDRLIGAGLLVPSVPVAEQSTSILADSREFLRSLGPGPGRRVSDILGAIEQNVAEFGGAEAAARARSLGEMTRGWQEAFELAGEEMTAETMVYEDTAIPTRIRLRPGIWDRITHELQSVLPLLELFDGGYLLKAVVRDEFVGRYGVGGRCSSLFDFKEFIPKIYDRWAGAYMTEGVEEMENDPYLGELWRLRERTLQYLVDQVSRDKQEIELSPEFVEEVKRELPDGLGSGWASYSVFLQAEMENGEPKRAVVNHIYHGLGRFASRFLPLLGEESVDHLKGQIASFFPGNHVPAEVRPVKGFNANLHPRLTEVEFDLGGPAEEGAGEKIDFSEILLEHDVGSDCVVARHSPTGRVVDALYLGFLVPYLIPHEMGLLCSLTGSMLVDLPFHEALDERLTYPAKSGEVRSYPRVRFGDVVLCRRRWHVPKDRIPRPGPGETEPCFFTRLNAWREQEGIPREVFFKVAFGAARGEEASDEGAAMPYFAATRTKPQYIHFHSPLHVRHLTKWLHKNQADLVAEEVLPFFDKSVVRSVDGAHAAEMVFEFNRPARFWKV